MTILDSLLKFATAVMGLVKFGADIVGEWRKWRTRRQVRDRGKARIHQPKPYPRAAIQSSWVHGWRDW